MVQAAQALALLRGRSHVVRRGRRRPRRRRAAPPARAHLRRARRRRAAPTTCSTASSSTVGGPRRASRRGGRGARRIGRVTRAASPTRPGARARGRCRRALVEALDLVLARRAAGALPGRAARGGPAARAPSSRRCGPYQVGDDVRRLDAAASARTGIPHVRDHVPERTLTTWLLRRRLGLDGLRHRRPPEVRRRRGRRARDRPARGAPGGRVGLLTCGAPDAAAAAAARRPRRAGRACAARSRRASRRRRPRARRTRSRPGCAAIGRLARGPGLVVVVIATSARGRRPRAPLGACAGALAARHDVLAVEVVDPREAELPDAGHLVARRSRDRRARRGRHVQRRAAAALRGRRAAPAATTLKSPPARARARGTSRSPPTTTGCARSDGACR